MNLGYFPTPDSGIEKRADWAMPSSGVGENAEAQWDETRTPDHSAIYDERAVAFYDGALAKLKEYGYGDLPNPFRMVNEFERALNIGDGYKPMVDTVRAVAPKNYQMGTPLNIIPLRNAWRAELDHILQEARVAHPDISDPAAFDKNIAEESAATRERAAEIASRATFMGHLGGFAGGTAGTLSRTDQMVMTAITLPFGGGAATLARTLVGRLLAVAATDAALGAAQTGASEFAEAKFQQEHFGYSKTGREIAMDMAFAAAGSALLGVGLQGVGEGGAYLLSRWRTRSAGVDVGEINLPLGGLTPVEAAAPIPAGGEPIVVGLSSAAEQAEALYSVLPKGGRDAATILESERQVAANGPAADLFSHSENVAQAAEAVTNGERPIPTDLPGRNYFESEATPDGHPLETQYQVVEADELLPLTLRQQMNAAAKQAEYEWKQRVAAGWVPHRKGHNLRAAKGQAAHGVLRAWVKGKATRDNRWRSEPRLFRPNGKYYQPDVLTPRNYIFELKSTTDGGKIAGKRKGKSYLDELGRKVRIIYYDP